jgi:Contractile injection system tube protein
MNSPVQGGGGGALSPPSPTGDSSRPQVQRASLKMYDSSPATGGRKLEGMIGTIDFQFNPKEVTIAKVAKWESKPSTGAKKASPPQFTGPEPGKLTLEMFFDATANHDGSVVEAVDKLFSCCVATAKTHANNKPVPPLVVFTWGKITSFPAYVTQVSAKYTLFSADGTPIRATCTVSLQEMPGEKGKQNPTSGALAVRSIHRFVVGDTLASVAYREYGDPTLWRQLASFNRIDDPMRIPLGSTLMLPSAAELAAAAVN